MRRNLLDRLVQRNGGYAKTAYQLNRCEMTIRNICAGKSSPTLKQAFVIANFFGYTVDELFGESFNGVSNLKKK